MSADTDIPRMNKIVSRELQDAPKTYDYFNQVGTPRQYITGSPLESHYVMTTDSHYENNHPEAYYLYFIAVVGIILNSGVVIAILYRRPLRKMTSGFLIHACFLDMLKSAFCIPFGTNLLSQTTPTNCDFLGASFVILVTTSVFNMVAMVCTEAYTFGEKNIGGNSKGTVMCIIFGIVLVYIGSLILHLGPTLISGHFEFHPDIGSCSFVYGKQTGYVAHIMWFVITTVAMLAVYHFIHRLHREIQINRPNRVSFLVRTSITVLDSSTTSTWKLRKIIRDATHRAKLFLLNTIIFIVCWYPFFLLVIIDKNFTVSLKAYQFFAFIAWSQSAIQPLVYIFFDRNLNLLSKYMKCLKSASDVDRFFDMLSARQVLEQTEDSMTVPGDHQNNLNIRSRPLPNIDRNHQDICIVQNNQNVHNYAMNIHSVGNLDLTNELNTTQNLPELQEFELNDNISESFSANSETLPSTPSTGNICDNNPMFSTELPPPIEEVIEIQL